ncbi:MAG: hypothetical protein LBV67_01535, partial [Streptococcaceae bacterium]|nr:hypothetical protein [Streptococcaceae bacterium]
MAILSRKKFLLSSLDNQVLFKLHRKPNRNIKSYGITRSIIPLITLIISLGVGTNAYSEDVEHQKTQEIENPTITNQCKILTTSHSATTKGNVDRKASIEKELTILEAKLANARAQLNHELQGSYDPISNQKRFAGRGPKALQWEAQISAINVDITKLQEEKSDLINNEQKLADAKGDIEKNLT